MAQCASLFTRDSVLGRRIGDFEGFAGDAGSIFFLWVLYDRPALVVTPSSLVVASVVTKHKLVMHSNVRICLRVATLFFRC